MPTAKKQSSGMWKVRVYSHTTPDGKKHYRSFSATTKQEAEQAAARFSGTAERAARVDLTVKEALNGYIRAKEGVLSPSTIREYKRLTGSVYDSIAGIRIRKLTSEIVQTFISDQTAQRSAKSVSNIYGLLTSAVGFYDPDIHFRVTLPIRGKMRTPAATDEEIMRLFDAADRELKKCIALAAFTSMRRGEICAIRYGDIQGNRIHVHADMVRGTSDWYVKPYPKTTDSDRMVPVPAEVVELLGTGPDDELIIKWIPDTITKRFIDLRNSLGLSLRFHDLRKYYASIAAALIPDLYAESFGGWRHGSRVMKEVYQQKIDPLETQFADTMRSHFGDVIQKSMTQSMT